MNINKLPYFILISIFLFGLAFAQESKQDNSLGLLGAGIAVAGSTLGAGIAVAYAASAGLASLTEKKEMVPWVLILAGLAEGIAIYGFIIAIMILTKV